MSNGSKIFSVLVVGENHKELMDKYDMNLKVEKYKKYKYLDAEKMKNNSIKIMEEIISNPKKFNLSSFHIDVLKEKSKALKEMSSFDYYSNITKGLYYDENGDAWSEENPNGKWMYSKIGDNFSMPLILKDGTTTKQAKYGDIDWNAMHMQNTHVYEIIWDMVKNGRTPTTEKEKTLYENMKDNVNYFNKFKNVDEYVVHNCAYWNYAFLDKNGWKDLDDGGSDVEWIATYFDKFLSNIDENELITIYECSKRDSDD